MEAVNIYIKCRKRKSRYLKMVNYVIINGKRKNIKLINYSINKFN